MRQLLMTLFNILLLMVSSVESQSQIEAVITAETIRQLTPVQQIDFAAFPTAFSNGWFAVNTDGTRIAISDESGIVYVINDSGTIILQMVPPDWQNGSYPGSLIDAAFTENHVYFLRIIDGLVYLNADLLDLPGSPVSLWAVEQDTFDEVYIELLPDPITGDAAIIYYQMIDGVPVMGDVIAYGPGEDEEAVVRIGRIAPPYAVTSTLTGTVTLWDLAQNKELYTVDNGTGQPAVFGNINIPPSHLVWRDNPNQTLFLLDLASGSNQVIDNLEGNYAQWFFLTQDASSILAVNLGFEPVIIAWNTQTQEKYTLGSYRSCNRPQPDMVRLTADGTTLVIGCDTGLEIWRVQPE